MKLYQCYNFENLRWRSFQSCTLFSKHWKRKQRERLYPDSWAFSLPLSEQPSPGRLGPVWSWVLGVFLLAQWLVPSQPGGFGKLRSHKLHGAAKEKKVGSCAHSHACGWEKYLRVRPQVPEKSALGIDPSAGHTTCMWEDLMTVPLMFPGQWVECLFQHVQLSWF